MSERLLEVSSQEVPTLGEAPGPVAESLPLHQLLEYAPALPNRWYDPSTVGYPFSNDEAAAYFEQVRARTMLPEYQGASNRVALLIGESSLASALKYIPEETILVIDNSLDMCLFMSRYVEGLRAMPTIDDWLGYMGIGDDSFMGGFKTGYMAVLAGQIEQWQGGEAPHALSHEDAFAQAQALASQKAIIPWRADITEPGDVRYLGSVLRSHGAHITMMNLTNLIPCESRFRHPGDCADTLRPLPVTAHAPILATSLPTGVDHRVAEAVGPYFGLENLGREGRYTKVYQDGQIVHCPHRNQIFSWAE